MSRTLSVVLTSAARADLLELWTWIAHDNPDAADRYLGRIAEVTQSLADTPEVGRRRDELAPGLRSFVVEKHVVFYRLTTDAVQIVRVLSGRRDVDAQL